jgi:hypothetical protein
VTMRASFCAAKAISRFRMNGRGEGFASTSRRRPSDAPWVWTLAYGQHRDRSPTHGFEPTREAAMAAFAKSWRRE